MITVQLNFNFKCSCEKICVWIWIVEEKKTLKIHTTFANYISYMYALQRYQYCLNRLPRLYTAVE